jgi:hypothetical protein
MNITIANFGWVILAWLAAGVTINGIETWFTGQYEVTRHGFRFTAGRRWYGVRAWIVLRTKAEEDEPDRYQVLGWDQEDTRIPWVRVMNIDNEAAESFWAPVTDFCPRSVRRLRPWLVRYGRLRVPALFDYRPVRQPAGYLGGGT